MYLSIFECLILLKLCFHNVLEATKLPQRTLTTSGSTGTAITTGMTSTVTESKSTEETSSGRTSVSTLEGSTPTPTGTVLTTTFTGSTTVSVSGTTTKRCEEMQAVDAAVSQKITVQPKELPIGENIKFQPTSLHWPTHLLLLNGGGHQMFVLIIFFYIYQYLIL